MLDNDSLISAFRGHFPGSPTPFLVRAPGRVNLIGEHTDYNGLPVLPMTIAQDIRVACGPRKDGRVSMRNAAGAFRPAEFDNASEIAASPAGSWENYCKAAVQGMNRHFKPGRLPGMDLLVSGSIPMRAGLSSSSALVVACALAYLRALGKTLDKDITRIGLAGLLAEAEHYVGTQGGGMDQAVILLGQAGRACKIDFYPLRVEQVAMPADHAFVVCNSLVVANKTGEALHRYNAGPRLSRLICALVEKQCREEFDDEIRLERLGDLWSGHLCLTHDEVAGVLGRALPSATTTLAQAADRLGIAAGEIRERWIGDLAEPPEGFNLQARARHLRTECARVEAARDALAVGDAAGLGRLMDESHKSCAEEYRISCPELDRLVVAARRAGAAGARLTGAGFGGCTVNLVARDRVYGMVAGVQKDYYGGLAPVEMGGGGGTFAGGPPAPQSAAQSAPQFAPQEAVFVAESSGGAGYL